MLTRRPHQTQAGAEAGEAGPISPAPVMFVNMMWNTRGLCLAVSKQLFVFDMLDSIVPLPGRPKPEWIPIYFPQVLTLLVSR